MGVEEMQESRPVGGLSRRSFVKASSAALILTATAVIHLIEGWGLESKGLAPAAIQTLIQASRDIYPHDRLADRFYAVAVKDFDTKIAADTELKALFEEGVAKLDAAARAAHGVPYVEVGWEEDRVALLKQIETTTFFGKLRAGLVTGLYNQKEIWPLFGYEGSSADKGGYINRGFNDLTWL
jgi:Gluconate 2-dehydrogenase subunit 3